MSNSRPTYEAFSVRNSESGKSFWTKIGAAWDHEDGKGLSLVLDLIPVNGGKIVLREPKED